LSVPADGKQRLAVGIEYDGSGYSGWQTQPHAPSVQDTVDAALSAVADRPVSTVAAGRTDTGVHATGQVVHFDTSARRPERSWLLGANSNLPPDVNALWVCQVPESFHARYSATGREYCYRILNRPVRSALLRERAWWVREALDVGPMREAAAMLIGEHDFSAYRAAACQSKTPVRDLRRLDVERQGMEVYLTCEANAFLHHMVRNLVGTLVRIGRGEERPQWAAELLRGRDRRLSGITAPAAGLTLTAVYYPAEFGLPPETS
jgi:tRNA pseudouridine38-40 synthase